MKMLRLGSINQLPKTVRELNTQIVNDKKKKAGYIQLDPEIVSFPPLRRGKFGNKKFTAPNGEVFDSQLEYRCAHWLDLRRHDDVAFYCRQVRFRLEGGVVYVLDFLVILKAGGYEAIDAKGFQTRESKNKIKQMRERYGIHVQLWPKHWEKNP